MGADSICYIGFRALRRLATIMAMVLLLARWAFALDLQMKIDDAKFDNGAVVKFLLVASDQVPITPDRLKTMIAGSTDDNRFVVFADVDSITVNPSFENYDFYIRAASSPVGAPLTRFSFQVTPYDTFPDQDKRLQIHLLDGVQDRIVELSVPVHSLKAGDSLTTQLNTTAKVRLSGGTISIEVENKYFLPVQITSAYVEQVSNAHWTSQPLLASSVPFVLGSDNNNNHATITWKVQPRAWGVLRDSLMPFSPSSAKESEASDNLEFSIGYTPLQGGFPHTLTVHRNVYFYPSLSALLGVASLGAIAAGLVMFFGIRKDSGLLKFFKYLWPNIVFALLVEVIAIVLFSFDNSKIQIGAVNLNPTLLIPATCVGALSVFYGFQLIEKWLGKAGQKSHPAVAGGGGP